MRVKNETKSYEATAETNMRINQVPDNKNAIIKLFNSMHIDKVKPFFDVYPPNSKFKKSSPGNPNFVFCFTSGLPPSKQEINNLERQCNGIPLKFCSVEHGRVSFFSFNTVELPLLP